MNLSLHDLQRMYDRAGGDVLRQRKKRGYEFYLVRTDINAPFPPAEWRWWWDRLDGDEEVLALAVVR